MAEAHGAGSDLDRWLAPFLEVLRHKKRRTWAPLYLRGLLGPGERKSLQPMAARLGLPGHDQLQHFISSAAWDDGPLWTALAREADRLVGGPGAALVIDDTALPKKGALSVGVARQYCGQLGKKANCQALVSLTLAGKGVPIPVGLRLFLPDDWTREPARCAAAGVPEAEVVARSKGEIALAELDRLRAAGVRFGVVLADAGYGASAEFRRGLDGRGLAWAVGIPRNQKVYGADVRLVPPGGRKRRPVPDQEPREAEAVLAGLPWRRVTWRRGTKGPLAARFAATRIRVGDGATWANNRHLPGAEVWLVGEWRASGERKYHLSNLPPRISLRGLAAAIKARWICEQAHQQLKQELGLGHFEGRSWTGLHRHALMSCIAFAYLQHLRLAGAATRAAPGEVGGKSRAAFRGRHQHRACRRCAAPSWRACSQISSRRSDARAAGTGSGRRLTSDCPSSVNLGYDVPQAPPMPALNLRRRESATAARAVLQPEPIAAKMDRLGRRASYVLNLLDNTGIRFVFVERPEMSDLETDLRPTIAQEEGRLTPTA